MISRVEANRLLIQLKKLVVFPVDRAFFDLDPFTLTDPNSEKSGSISTDYKSA
ncbi:MAG: hypothetical protein WBF52_01400 [Geitlerinemataceae cyanobacterium]